MKDHLDADDYSNIIETEELKWIIDVENLFRYLKNTAFHFLLSREL